MATSREKQNNSVSKLISQVVRQCFLPPAFDHVYFPTHLVFVSLEGIDHYLSPHVVFTLRKNYIRAHSGEKGGPWVKDLLGNNNLDPLDEKFINKSTCIPTDSHVLNYYLKYRRVYI